MKRILDIGQCNYDHSSITQFLKSNWDVEVDRAYGWSDAERFMANVQYDLILVNRLLDQDHTEGQQIIESLKADEKYQSIPVMMVSNYADAQEKAVQAGAVPGFGKSTLNSPETKSNVEAALNN